MNKAFIVIGPESSGTKVTTSLFCHAGCYGDYTHLQRLDAFVEGADFPKEAQGKDVVFRRSVPHGGRFHGIELVQNRFSGQGLAPKWIITVRDWYCNTYSAPKYGHKRSVQEEKEKLPLEWVYIGNNLRFMKDFYFLLTSQMFLDPERALYGLSVWAGIDLVKHSSIVVDADEKYFR